MKKEELIALGIDEEVAKKVMAINGTDIENAKAKAGQATEKVSQELENLKSELDLNRQKLVEANTQIQKFKEMDVESIKQSAEEWKNKYTEFENQAKADKEAFEKKLQEQQYDFKLNEIAGQHKFVDDLAREAFINNLKKQEFKFGEDGTLQGANDYINKFKEDHKGIFVVEEAPKEEPAAPQFTNPMSNQQPKQENQNMFGFNFTPIHKPKQ